MFSKKSFPSVLVPKVFEICHDETDSTQSEQDVANGIHRIFETLTPMWGDGFDQASRSQGKRAGENDDCRREEDQPVRIVFHMLVLLLFTDGLFLVLFAGDHEFTHLDHFLGALQAQGHGLGLGDGFSEVSRHFQLDGGGPRNDLLTVAVVVDVHEVFAGLGAFEKEFLGSVATRIVG